MVGHKSINRDIEREGNTWDPLGKSERDGAPLRTGESQQGIGDPQTPWPGTGTGSRD